MGKPRSHLAPYEGQRVKVSGYFVRSETHFETYNRMNRVAAVEEIEIETSDSKFLELDHAWVQRANEIINARPQKGNKLCFSAVINAYGKTDPETKQKIIAYGLKNPEDVEVLPGNADYYYIPKNRPILAPSLVPAPEPESTPEPILKASAAKTLRAVKELVCKVDAEALRKVAPHLQEIKSAIDLSGSESEFLELLALL